MCVTFQRSGLNLGPSINGLVSDGNTKLCCRSFILALFQSTTAHKIDSEQTRGYKRYLPVCEAEILRVSLKKMKFFPFFMLIYDEFRLKVQKKNLKRVPRFLADVHKDR